MERTMAYHSARPDSSESLFKMHRARSAKWRFATSSWAQAWEAARAAQNGVQIGFGAGGVISGNTVTNNLWSPCTAVDTCLAVATNILVTQSNGVEVTDNGVGISQVGIFIHGNQGLAKGNTTFASSVFDGIRLEGDGNQVRHNQVFNGAESGIFIAGNNNVVEHNKIMEAAVGVLKGTGSLGNVIRFNEVVDTLVTVQDPASPGLAGVALPER